MATTNQRLTPKRKINPLTVATPLLDGESITSWLIRASLNQGCDPCVFIHHFWGEHKLWNIDFDKGFNLLDPSIHQDMAILADTSITKFDKQNTIAFAKLTNGFKNNQRVNWMMPMARATGRQSATGYWYCPCCFETDEQAYLNLDWRFSWALYCEKHQVILQNTCGHCGKIYQPQLLTAQKRYINRCHHCGSKLNQTSFDKPIYQNIYQFQKTAKQVWRTNQGEVFGQIVDAHNWFNTVEFLIALLRKSALAKNTIQKKLMNHLSIVNHEMPIYSPKTGLSFDYLNFADREMLLFYVNTLQCFSIKKWLTACHDLGVTKNAFNAIMPNPHDIPTPVLMIYEQLPSFKKPRSAKQSNDIKPKSAISVLRSWERLQRKIKMQSEIV